MNTKTKATVNYDDIVRADEVSKPEVTTTVRFEDTDNVFFEPTKGGMQVVMKGQTLPPFNGSPFSEDFIQHLRDHNVSGLAQDFMYDAVFEGLRKGMALDAILDCMK